MTLPQAYAIGIIVAVMVLMLWGRLRYDIVACIGLVSAVVLGVVPPKDMFKGFSDDIVIIVASALVVSATIARSGLFEIALGYLQPYLKTTQAQIVVLVVTVGALSAIVKNIGALAMLMPIAFQFARAGNRSASVFLMPMAFASLLGGIVTLVGTSPNIIVSRVREEITGKPFEMFDFAPVGIFIAAAGIGFLCIGYRLLPRNRQGSGTLGDALDIRNYVTEAHVLEGSQIAGRTLSELTARAQGQARVTVLMRAGRYVVPLPDTVLRADDGLILSGDPKALDRLVREAGLALESEHRPAETADAADEIVSVEVVVGPDSALIGSDAGLSDLHARHGVNLLAVGRSGEVLKQRLRDITIRAGDVLVMQGSTNMLPQKLSDLGLLPLAARTITLGERRPGWIALTVLAAIVAALAFHLVPVPVAFFCGAGAMIVFGALPVRDAYKSVEWPILIMFAALIPLSDALSSTGAAKLIADGMTAVGSQLPAWAALGLLLASAMAVTPFLNNAATVLIMAPIGATFAKNLGYNPDPFLMAVAIGAACDFLTPIGHQCNTLVMGPGGYRFTDYARLGAPLSILVLVMAVPLIMFFWPLR